MPEHPQTNFWRTRGWAELPFFLAVARNGSLRSAAEDLGINHATVNRNIRQLEDQMGVRLFDRTTKGLVLTSAGHGLMGKAEEAESAVLGAQRLIGGLDAKLEGPVRLSVSTYNSVLSIAGQLPKFRELYPDIDLHISVTDDVVDMVKNKIDVSLRGSWTVEENVTAKQVYQYSQTVIASREYIEKHWKNRGPDGEGLHWIGQSTLWPNPDLERLNLFPKAERVFDLKDVLLIIEFLKRGLGMAILPTITVMHIPELEIMPKVPIAADRNIWVLLHTDLQHTARVRAVVDFMAANTRKLFNAEERIIREHLATGAQHIGTRSQVADRADPGEQELIRD